MISDIYDGDLLIAKIIHCEEWDGGLTFYSKEGDFLQVATWNYGSGKHLKAHGHKVCGRSSNRTNELIYIKSGKVKLHLFSENDIKIREAILVGGDVAIIYCGGHGYDILEDKTQVLEVKNGPYPGIEKDKKVIEV